MVNGYPFQLLSNSLYYNVKEGGTRVGTVSDGVERGKRARIQAKWQNIRVIEFVKDCY